MSLKKIEPVNIGGMNLALTLEGVGRIKKNWSIAKKSLSANFCWTIK